MVLNPVWLKKREVFIFVKSFPEKKIIPKSSSVITFKFVDIPVLFN